MDEMKTGLIEAAVAEDPSSVDLFRTIFERIQTAIMVVDPVAHKIVDANPLMETLTGISRNQMLGRGCQGFVCPAKCGECPVTDLHKNILNIEREIINAKGARVPVLKTVAKAEIAGKEYLIESFTDITDRAKAEERQLALIVFLSESILRAKKPLELMQADFRELAGQVTSGDYDAEDIRMQLQMHANNLGQILKNIEELQRNAVEGRTSDLPLEYQEFFVRK
jgi:PAS domain S-box-containing protein